MINNSLVHIHQHIPNGQYFILCDKKRTSFVKKLVYSFLSKPSFYKATCEPCAIQKYYMMLARGEKQAKIDDLLKRFKLNKYELDRNYQWTSKTT